jgi:hypothetical protein
VRSLRIFRCTSQWRRNESRPVRAFPQVRLGFRLSLFRALEPHFTMEFGPGVDQHCRHWMSWDRGGYERFRGAARDLAKDSSQIMGASPCLPPRTDAVFDGACELIPETEYPIRTETIQTGHTAATMRVTTEDALRSIADSLQDQPFAVASLTRSSLEWCALARWLFDHEISCADKTC